MTSSMGRIALGFVLASGFIVAACIGAIPSVTCAALADIYVRALVAFGASATVVGMGAALLYPNSKQTSSQVLWGRVFCGIGVVMFVFSALSCLSNLRHGTDHCLQSAANLHDKIPLSQAWEFWVWMRG